MVTKGMQMICDALTGRCPVHIYFYSLIQQDKSSPCLSYSRIWSVRSEGLDDWFSSIYQGYDSCLVVTVYWELVAIMCVTNGGYIKIDAFW